MRKVVDQAVKFAAYDCPVLITGESGSGKEHMANVLRDESVRRHMPFIAINCAQISKELAAAELFGCVKGAYSGAIYREGHLRSVDGGTILLDEVHMLPLEAQCQLHRVLDKGEIIPVGSSKLITVDVRVICATNKDLLGIPEDKFGRELFYRINELLLEVPRLRDRREDIIPIAEHFLQQFNGGATTIGPNAVDPLIEYHWPGNVRQLRSAIRQAAISCERNLIDFDDLPGPIKRSWNSHLSGRRREVRA